MFAIALCQLLLECLSFFVSCQTETYFNAKTTTNFKGFSKFAHEQIGSLRNPYSCKHVGKTPHPWVEQNVGFTPKLDTLLLGRLGHGIPRLHINASLYTKKVEPHARKHGCITERTTQS